jgi:hypothetical protein
MALKKGGAMVEFYSLLPVLKSMYEIEGFRSAKILFENAKNRYKIQMSYEQFNIYFKRELLGKKEFKSDEETAKKEPQKTQKNVEDLSVPEIVKLIEEGKLSDELITQLEEAGKIEFHNLPKDHDLWMPPMVKNTTKRYIHNAGVPDGAPRF